MRDHTYIFAAVLILALAGAIMIWKGESEDLPDEFNARSVMKITSSAFKQGGMIPAQYTCDGENENPSLVFSDIPKESQSLALIVDDPDAPAGTWVHWTVWNISPDTAAIGEGEVPAGATEGTTSFGRAGYGGPCPPSGTHRYYFKLYALDTVLELREGSERDVLEKAMGGHVIEEAELMGIYTRN